MEDHWDIPLTPGNAALRALRFAESLGHGPVRRHWFALGAELHVTSLGRKRALRPTERQMRWLEEGIAFAARSAPTSGAGPNQPALTASVTP